MHNLAFKGVSAIYLGIAPRHKFEINNTNEPITEDLTQIIYDETGTVRAKAFIV